MLDWQRVEAGRCLTKTQEFVLEERCRHELGYFFRDGERMAVVGGAIAACWAGDRIRLWRWKSRFDARFPPLSAEEFLRRCGPEVNPATALKVRQIVARQLNLPETQIYPEQDFHRDLDDDSGL